MSYVPLPPPNWLPSPSLTIKEYKEMVASRWPRPKKKVDNYCHKSKSSVEKKKERDINHECDVIQRLSELYRQLQKYE